MAVELRGWPLRKAGASSGTGNKNIRKNTLYLCYINILVHSQVKPSINDRDL